MWYDIYARQNGLDIILIKLTKSQNSMIYDEDVDSLLCLPLTKY